MDAERLRDGEVFDGLDDRQLGRFAEIARPRSLRTGECLILLGDNADRFYMVLEGRVDLCFPFSFRGSLKDICVESKLPGSSLGWSALVKPYRFTLSARAAEASEVAAFLRHDLQDIFDSDPVLAHIFMKRIAEVIGGRLLKIQALWAREVQRSVTRQLEPRAEVGPDDSLQHVGDQASP